MVKTVAQIDSPRPRVFSALTDFPRYSEWVPGCERCTVLTATGNVAETEIVLNAMKTITLGLRFESEVDQIVKFNMTKGKDVRKYAGSYRLMDAADGQGTVVITELEIDVGPMMPSFMVDKVVKKMLGDTSTALQKHARTLVSSVQAVAPKASSAPATPKRTRATRSLLRVTRTGGQDEIWYMGKTFKPKP